MTLVNNILQQMPAVGQPQRTCLVRLGCTILALPRVASGSPAHLRRGAGRTASLTARGTGRTCAGSRRSARWRRLTRCLCSQRGAGRSRASGSGAWLSCAIGTPQTTHAPSSAPRPLWHWTGTRGSSGPAHGCRARWCAVTAHCAPGSRTVRPARQRRAPVLSRPRWRRSIWGAPRTCTRSQVTNNGSSRWPVGSRVNAMHTCWID